MVTAECTLTASGTMIRPYVGWYAVVRRGSLVQRHEFSNELEWRRYCNHPTFDPRPFTEPSAETKNGRAVREARERRSQQCR